VRHFCFVLLLVVFSPLLRAFDSIDLYQSAQTWQMRFQGYRTYRVEVPLASKKRCILSLSAHVNPQVEKFTLLLHGFADSRFSWWKWIKLYKDYPSYTGFIALDWPQHGGSNCDQVTDMDEVVESIYGALQKLARPIDRIVAQSLGVLPASLLVSKYPQAQQIWLTPPVLKTAQQAALRKDILDLDNTAKVQVFMHRILTERREFPNFVLKNMLERIQKAQKIVKNINSQKMSEQILVNSYPKLLVIGGAKDQLTPPQDWDPRLKKIAAYPIQYVSCAHDILRKCGEDVRRLVEQSRYDLRKAVY
jgi:pimeloyl-ACP methyl ester carboxylesterase